MDRRCPPLLCKGRALALRAGPHALALVTRSPSGRAKMNTTHSFISRLSLQPTADTQITCHGGIPPLLSVATSVPYTAATSATAALAIAASHSPLVMILGPCSSCSTASKPTLGGVVLSITSVVTGSLAAAKRITRIGAKVRGARGKERAEFERSDHVVARRGGRMA